MSRDVSRRAVLETLGAVGGVGGAVGAGWWWNESAGRSSGEPSSSSVNGVRNVILVLADGMGPEHLEAAGIYARQASGNEGLEARRFPVSGRMATANEFGTVTDSAASATAMATGEKVENGAIGGDRTITGFSSHPTVLERAASAGYATGLVTTDELTGATPAAFAAHVPDRDQQFDIARQYIEEQPAVLLGGMNDHFEPDDRDDGRNLIREAVNDGYEHVETARELRGVSGEEKLLGLFTEDGTFADDFVFLPGRSGGPSLEALFDSAVTTLEARSERGFFLLVENELSDSASHDNDIDAVAEVAATDAIAGRALDYAEQATGETLVIFTGDHETGGLTVDAERFSYTDRTGYSWSTEGHTAERVPVFAIGPGASRLADRPENTDVTGAVETALGL